MGRKYADTKYDSSHDLRGTCPVITVSTEGKWDENMPTQRYNSLHGLHGASPPTDDCIPPPSLAPLPPPRPPRPPRPRPPLLAGAIGREAKGEGKNDMDVSTGHPCAKLFELGSGSRCP